MSHPYFTNVVRNRIAQRASAAWLAWRDPYENDQDMSSYTEGYTRGYEAGFATGYQKAKEEVRDSNRRTT